MLHQCVISVSVVFQQCLSSVATVFQQCSTTVSAVFQHPHLWFGVPAQALQWFEENPAPDLVLMDVMMPEIGGLDVLARVRERHTASDLPVVMLTSRSDSATIVRALETGANYWWW